MRQLVTKSISVADFVKGSRWPSLPLTAQHLDDTNLLEAAVRVGFKSMENSLILVSMKTIIINASCYYRQESMEQGSCTLNALQYTSADILLQGCSGC